MSSSAMFSYTEWVKQVHTKMAANGLYVKLYD